MLEGFPRTADEVRWMAEGGYFPDTAIIINSEDSDIIGRLLPPKMEQWKAKRNRWDVFTLDINNVRWLWNRNFYISVFPFHFVDIL